ncbi:MAG: hypothetical protein ACRD8Z_10695, partial [Nitrososphaeraceae archaeon]
MGIHNSTDNNRISIDCLKEKLKRICKEGSAPSYLDCKNIFRCIDGGEQEIMKCPQRVSSSMKSLMLITLVSLSLM